MMYIKDNTENIVYNKKKIWTLLTIKIWTLSTIKVLKKKLVKIASPFQFLSLIRHFSFDLTEWWYCQYQQTDRDAQNYRSMWRQMHYDITNKNNIASFEYLNRHVYIIGLAVILVIMFVSTFKTAVILFLSTCWIYIYFHM
jgi:hypothetical protein